MRIKNAKKKKKQDQLKKGMQCFICKYYSSAVFLLNVMFLAAIFGQSVNRQIYLYSLHIAPST